MEKFMGDEEMKVDEDEAIATYEETDDYGRGKVEAEDGHRRLVRTKLLTGKEGWDKVQCRCSVG